MKRIFGFVLVGLLSLAVFSTPVAAGRNKVKVMTRNQYLGANLEPVVLAQTPEEFLAEAINVLNTIAVNNFPLRARRLATEILLTRPDLIGLQEVFDFRLNNENVGTPFVDHLAETLEALDDKGLSYVVAATVENLDITIPIEGLGFVQVLDRDVILVREGVDFTPLSGDFSAGGLCGVPIPNPVSEISLPPTLVSEPSEDGCNYTIVAQVEDPPLGDPIPIERGFVGVDATVRGKTYRFVNTHLEGAQPDPTDSDSAIIQSLQAVELVGTLQATTPPGLPLILVGDFNSSPNDASVNSDVPYQIIVDGGFADIWDRNPFKFFDPYGLTCCQDDDLLNTTSLLDERLDLIFVRGTSFLPLAFVTGRVPIFPLRQPPNWASDHSGVFGKLIFK
jgi:endonuclease/exonuclease/phosphatase family metal-dependent hydrolase